MGDLVEAIRCELLALYADQGTGPCQFHCRVYHSDTTEVVGTTGSVEAVKGVETENVECR